MIMRMLIADTQDLSIQVGDELKAPQADKKLIHCTGCFGCWIKTPGRCIIKDAYMTMGEELKKCEELILISKCTYGGFSPFVKNILDRSISYILPHFEIINSEMHHKRRYDNTIKVSAYFYGEDISEKEKEIAKQLVHANMVNFHGVVTDVCFFNTVDEIKEALA